MLWSQPEGSTNKTKKLFQKTYFGAQIKILDIYNIEGADLLQTY